MDYEVLYLHEWTTCTKYQWRGEMMKTLVLIITCLLCDCFLPVLVSSSQDRLTHLLLRSSRLMQYGFLPLGFSPS